MKVISPVWDYRDDYYFACIDDIEINIRAYSQREVTLWMYCYSDDEELVDAYYKSMQELKNTIDKVLGADVIVPSIEKILKVTKGYKNV